MSRAARRREQRDRHSKGGRPSRRWVPFWILGGSALAAILTLSAINAVTESGDRHPEPRAEAEAPHVMPTDRYAEYPRVAEAYELTAAVPSVVDGLYCYCQCSEHSGHYSLLDCFASDHAARCDVCMSEAVIASQMTRGGASLDDIRAEIDRVYGT